MDKDLLDFLLSKAAKVAAKTPKSFARLNQFVTQAATQAFTRKPGALGSLDPGSFYGYVTSQPQTKEGQAAIASDVALQFMGGVKPVKSPIINKDVFRIAKDYVTKFKPREAVTSKVDEATGFLKDLTDEARKVKDPGGFTQPMEDIIRAKFNEVKKKANVIDYFRTPNRALEKFGLGEEAKLLRQKYDDYLAELPKEIDKITSWSKRVGPGANERIFRYLDGKLPRLDNPDELRVAKEIRGYLREWATKLKLPPGRQISDYITHLFPKGAIEKEFDPEVAKLISGKVVKSVYDPFLQKRVGMPEYLEDTWRALDAYTKRAVRKYHMDQALEQVAAKAENLPLESYNYVKGRIARINMQPSDIDNLIDNAIKSSPIGYRMGQRPLTAVTQKARQMVFRGLLGLNPATALRNLQQGANTYAVLGEKNFGVGLMKTVQNLPRLIAGKETELEKAGVLGKDIIQDRTLNAVGKFWQKTDDTLFYMFNLAEKVNRGTAFWGAKAAGISKGMSEEKAIEFAKSVVGKTQFYYDAIDTPAALSSDLAKTIFQFAKYPLAQTEFMAEMVKNKNVLGSLRWIGANLLFIGTAGKILGLEPKDMFPQFRFGVPPTLQLPWEVGKAVMNAPDKYGNVSEEANPLKRIIESPGVKRGALNYLPAGGQIRKSVEGIKAYQEGASLTPTGRVRYEIPQNLSTALRVATMGQYSLPQAKEYFARKESGKSQSELLHEELKKLPPDEADKRVAELKERDPGQYAALKRVFEDEAKKTTEDEKTMRALLVRDGSRARAVARLLKPLDEKERARVFDDLVAKHIITEEVFAQLREMKKQGKL